MTRLDPFDFVRIVTASLASVWTVTALVRLFRFVKRWERRFERWGLDTSWLRRAVLIAVARVTVLDPINLALILALLGVWTLRTALG